MMNELMRTKHAGRGTLSEFDRFLQNMLNPFEVSVPELMGRMTDYPHIAVEKNEKDVTARLPLPGFKAENISVDVVGKQLTIRAKQEKSGPDREKKGHYIRRERSFSEFMETVRLPCAVKGAETCARYTDGVLCVTMPLETEAPKTHKIEVK